MNALGLPLGQILIFHRFARHVNDLGVMGVFLLFHDPIISWLELMYTVNFLFFGALKLSLKQTPATLI